MKTLNFDYDVNTADEVRNELEEIARMSTDEVCDKYCLDSEDVNRFINLMKADLDTLLSEENANNCTNDRDEEYGQLYNFL